MTVRELINVLAIYPDDMDVKISYGHCINNVDYVTTIIDIDTNLTGVDIHAGG